MKRTADPPRRFSAAGKAAAPPEDFAPEPGESGDGILRGRGTGSIPRTDPPARIRVASDAARRAFAVEVLPARPLRRGGRRRDQYRLGRVELGALRQARLLLPKL